MKIRIACLCILLICATLPAFAAEKPIPRLSGSFNITAYLEPNLSSPYTWCFDFTTTGTVLGFANSGTWNVPSYGGGWSGEWYVDGDELVFHGVAAGEFIFSYKGRLVASNRLAGRQVEFFIDGSTDTAGTFYGAKVSTGCPTTAAVTRGKDPAKP